MINNPDSLVFDMDGTLWDAVETYALAWNKYFELNDMDNHFTKSDLMGYMGFEQSKYLEIILPQFSVEKRNDIYKEVVIIQDNLIDSIGGNLYDGVLEGVKLLSKKYKLFIVSNCPEFTILHFMKWAKIEDYITDTMAHGQNFRPKYENIQHLIEKHALKNPFYIGDTDSDAIQSSIAGIPFIFMDYGFGETTSYYEKFGSFSALTKNYIK